ncbi:hypothetical protein [Thermopirellula anaerolimosa]
MSKPLFHVHCTTCGARLKVTDRRAVGAILACPKCQCMVEVVPPPGFRLEDHPVPPPAPTVPHQPEAVLQGSEQAGLSSAESPSQGGAADALGLTPGMATAEPTASHEVDGSAESHAASPSPGEEARSRSVKAPPIARGTVPPAAEEDWDSELSDTAATWLSPAESRVRKILLVVAGGIAVIAIVAGVWVFRDGTAKNESGESAAAKVDAQTPPEQSEAVSPPSGDASPVTGPTSTPMAQGEVFTSWLPSDAILLMGGGHEFRRSLAQTAWLFSPLLPNNADALISDAMKSLGILPNVVAWVGLGVGPAGPPQTVVMFRLRDDQSTASLESLGRPADVAIRNHKTIVLQGSERNQLLILVDAKTVLLGDADYLQSAGGAGDDANSNHGPWRDLGKDGSQWFVGVDLERWRSQNYRFPRWVLDRLPDVMPHWRRILDSSSALSVEMLRSEKETRLTCRWSFPSDGDADAGAESLNALTEAARQLVDQQKETLASAVESGAISAEIARPLETLLSLTRSLLDSVAVEKTNDTVVLNIPLEQGAEHWIEEAIGARPLLESDWLQRGAALWRLRGETLGAGLQAAVEAEGLFPQAAAGGSLLPPDTRLSWIASTLPYFGYNEWHARINPGYGWRAPQNRPITSRELPEVINPLLGPTQSREGFFDSHWVGVAGVGEDAASLPLDDPRAGLFNYNGRRRLQDLERGAANTLAVLGASSRLGAWAEGGFATARPLTRRPYVDGPDGFGSGLPQGMSGMMADGSVRLIHRDIAPEVLERLAAVRGNGAATVADLFPPGTVPGTEMAGWPTAPGGNDVPTPPLPDGDRPPDSAPTETPLFPAEQALATRVTRVTMQDVPLGLVLHLLTQWSSIPVSVQPEALCAQDVSLRSPISLSLEDGTLQDIVRQVAEQAGLEVRMESSGVITLTSIRADLPETRLYSANDYHGCVSLDETLAELIRSIFGTNPAQGAAPDFEAVPVAEGLRIKCPPCTHREIENLLRRQLCRGPSEANQAPVEHPHQEAGDYLVSATFLQPTPLSDVLLILDQACEIDILVDWTHLVALGITPDTPVTLTADDTPIGQVLRGLGGEVPLGTLELEDSVIVTTPEIASRPVVRVYPLDSLLDSGTSAARIREQIVANCSPDSWVDRGGQGKIVPFAAAKCLVARNSPEVCDCIQKFLDDLAKKKD